jgi:8-oxo-dGTP pyrophosphatase MutT (NUDIX family)
MSIGYGHASVSALLGAYRPQSDVEAADTERVLALVGTAADPWSRATPVHLTASALIVHPDSGQVLLRWHQRQQAWLQVGGHADPGEVDPLAIALREAREETGLADLAPWPDQSLVHLAIVPVAAGRGEPEHEHADLRFVLATSKPDAAVAERPDAPLRWLSVADADALIAQDNLREALARVRPLLSAAPLP